VPSGNHLQILLDSKLKLFIKGANLIRMLISATIVGGLRNEGF
jgi:hypothetical protein